MKASANDLELEDLRMLFEKESSNLKTALLNGSSWEDVQDQRKKVTALSIALHKKMQASLIVSDNPAESTDRSAKRVYR